MHERILYCWARRTASPRNLATHLPDAGVPDGAPLLRCPRPSACKYLCVGRRGSHPRLFFHSARLNPLVLCHLPLPPPSQVLDDPEERARVEAAGSKLPDPVDYSSFVDTACVEMHVADRCAAGVSGALLALLGVCRSEVGRASIWGPDANCVASTCLNSCRCAPWVVSH